MISDFRHRSFLTLFAKSLPSVTCLKYTDMKPRCLPRPSPAEGDVNYDSTAGRGLLSQGRAQ